MSDPKEPEDLSSTLRHVKNVQGENDVDVSWGNLHDKVVKWVAEASQGQNLPTDKSLDDLTQEVLLQVFRDIAEFQVEPGASFSGWVRMIAHRKLNDYWRRERAKKRGGGRLKHLGDFDETGGREHFADDRIPRQSMLVRYKELQDSLQKALAELSDKHKRVIELRMFQGKSFAEIMPMLGYTKEVTVRSLHMRALQRLQELMAGFAG
ncbi:MAG: sigma-70 family RNA polymerase sigma factor [Planctomycetes bacterium]|jgi:RNA polymerase sigma factor (sigma-70 family)|nr:sigma-70 family RNA polymerase sigma factor [Planctomycetota bacterium]MCC7063655.1 sigma-70 family RNA polymerase sigma factor [Planctomycetota bacterium]